MFATREARSEVSTVPDAGRRDWHILQIGTSDSGGGAAAVASGLARGYRSHGCRVWHAVGHSSADDPDVFILPDDRRFPFRWSGYARLQAGLRRLTAKYPGRGWGLANRSLRIASHPRVFVERSRGIEDFEFPGTYDLFNLLDRPPDVVHCHNLHGGYFDLRALSWLSQRVATVVTLHDMWLLTGHCAYSLNCERWETGCGQCPDLALHPAVRRDATEFNWQRKKNIYAGSRLHVASPSRWLQDKLERSILADAVVDSRVIPNGVDLGTFQRGDKGAARVALGLPLAASIVLTTAGSLGSSWKDGTMMTRVIERMALPARERPIVFVSLGNVRSPMTSGGVEVRLLPYVSDPQAMAVYYRAADVYAHAARADTFPLAVLESLACGTPVVATAVGGIPEQVRPLNLEHCSPESEDVGEATGVLVPPRDPGSMAAALEILLDRDSMRRRLGDNAARDARVRFDLRRQVQDYLAWYGEILHRRARAARPTQ